MLASSFRDWANPELAPILRKTQRSANFSSEDKVKLLKAAWEALGSEFASRRNTRCFMQAPALSRPVIAIVLSIGVRRAAWLIIYCRPMTSRGPESLRHEWVRRQPRQCLSDGVTGGGLRFILPTRPPAERRPAQGSIRECRSTPARSPAMPAVFARRRSKLRLAGPGGSRRAT